MMLSEVAAIKHTPPPARAIPEHISVDVVLPMPRVNTRSGACGAASAAALDTHASVADAS